MEPFNKDNEKNWVFSSMGIQICGAMLYLGSTGKTAKELRNALELKFLPPIFSMDVNRNRVFVKKSFGKYIISEYINNHYFKMRNKIFVSKNYKLGQRFIKMTRKHFQISSEVTTVDVSNPEVAAQKINNWAKPAMQKDIISKSDINNDTQILVISNVYFKGHFGGTWFHPKLTEKAPFFINKKESGQVYMMLTDGRFRYGVTDGASIVQIPFQNSRIYLEIILPNTTTDLKSWTAKRYKAGKVGFHIPVKLTKMHVSIPKFVHNSSYDLTETIKNEVSLQRKQSQ